MLLLCVQYLYYSTCTVFTFAGVFLIAASVPELASNGTSVVMVTASDEDGSSLNFSIVSPPAAPFSINITTGLVSVQGSLDFESMDK